MVWVSRGGRVHGVLKRDGLLRLELGLDVVVLESLLMLCFELLLLLLLL